MNMQCFNNVEKCVGFRDTASDWLKSQMSTDFFHQRHSPFSGPTDLWCSPRLRPWSSFGSLIFTYTSICKTQNSLSHSDVVVLSDYRLGDQSGRPKDPQTLLDCCYFLPPVCDWKRRSSAFILTWAVFYSNQPFTARTGSG